MYRQAREKLSDWFKTNKLQIYFFLIISIWKFSQIIHKKNKHAKHDKSLLQKRIAHFKFKTLVLLKTILILAEKNPICYNPLPKIQHTFIQILNIKKWYFLKNKINFILSETKMRFLIRYEDSIKIYISH